MRYADITALLDPNSDSNVIEVSLGMCKYGYMDNQGQGLFCTGAHGSSANCRAATFALRGSGLSNSLEHASDWLASTENNPIVYTHLYHGEVYDARRETFNASLWTEAARYDFGADRQAGIGSLQLSSIPNIGVSQFLKAEKITRVVGSDGGPAFVFDFGHNIAGFTRLNDVSLLPASTRIVLRHAEILNEDGTIQNTYCSWPCPTTCGQKDGGNCANQTDVYISTGDAPSGTSWTPTHTYHGFRYVQVEGWPVESLRRKRQVSGRSRSTRRSETKRKGKR